MTYGPYSAYAELFRSPEHGFEEVLTLKLEPIAYKVAVPPFAQRGTVYEQVDWAVEMARQLIRGVRGCLTKSLFTAMLGDRAPKDFDWEKFEETEFERLAAEHKVMTQELQDAQRRILNYRGFMEANGRNWEAIEKLGQRA